MSENTAMRRRVIKLLRPLDAISVENGMVGAGTPDVNYIGGWVELKELKEWPKRPTTKVKIRHFTQQQKVWLRRRAAKGGEAYFLLKVQQEWLLFDGITAFDIGKYTREELTNKAMIHWKKGLKDKELLECLSPKCLLKN